ncbi:3-hydroxyacyl-CoA dehydrogenase NAD-binding domain-containing protein [Sphingomonas nostoxanthinifaciens]|uniref:3-hydroxyacyl-CoA dehydrogenase NAD-binding domain-containing protein n=1 Tax=Sphingomonas nostoxanthinifaciens TaxID=2872652 RepID=UPI001CC1DE3B|nr:3-hydroxyacyl-CoA dehydrogenase NAD-binding domain-containing protein [Sphingomonas nostoxanthinifaciens]UAK26279.1 hypothetical protein K8P63_09415 [Sphingomonas nostoxanthinifaciens]
MTTAKQDPIQGGKRAAIIGGGVIGASWAALFLANGLKVIISDPDPAIETKVKATIETAIPSLAAMGYDTADLTANLSFGSDTASAVADADIVQECGPERLDFKRSLWKLVEEAAPKDALLCSSSSTIPASVQSDQMTDKARLIIGHPFNPPHLMPLVEIVPTLATDPAVTAKALEFYQSVGKVPREIRKEVTGFVANRLQAAIFRESVYLVSEGVVELDELDDIMTNSLGIRWATSGPFLSFHLGGGAGGLRHFLEQFGPPTEASWKVLGQPKLDEATKALLIAQVDATYGKSAFKDLAETRDAKEIAVINGLAGIDRASHEG